MTKEVALTKQVAPLVQRADAFTIENDQDLTTATAFLSELNTVNDRMEEEEAKVLDPLKEAMKAEKARWTPYKKPLAEAIALIRGKMTTYRTEARKAAEAEAAKIAERVGEGRGKLKVETAIRKIEEIEGPADRVSTEQGSVKFRTVQRFRLVDITKVPADYLLINEPAVRAAGKRNEKIPGIEFFDEDIPINSR